MKDAKRISDIEKNEMTKRRDLKILWSSNAPHANSGYSIEMRDLLFRLIADGWPVAMSAFYGVQGGPAEIEYPSHLNPKFKGLKMKHYPIMTEPWGSDAMYFHGRDFKANVVFSMQDVWVLEPSYLSKIPAFIPWFPVDKEPIPPNVLDKLRYAYKIMCFSKFGYDQLLKHGFSSTFITEGTDVDIFKPGDRMEARKKLGLPPDNFYFSMVGANKENPPRKGYQEALEAFKMFHDKHPEAALLFHTQQRGQGGFPIKEYANHLGILNRTFFVDDYLSMFNSTSDVIATEYQACNAQLHPSQTEGFGLGIIEAQACGIPTVVQRCQSMPELVIDGKTGWIAETMHKRFTSDLSFVHVADPKSVYDCMEKAYEAVKNDEAGVAKACRDWVVENFNIDTLVETKWISFLEALQDELLPLTPSPSSV